MAEEIESSIVVPEQDPLEYSEGSSPYNDNAHFKVPYGKLPANEREKRIRYLW